MLRVVADLGNSRLKLGRWEPSGRVSDVISLPCDDVETWWSACENWGQGRLTGSLWAISTVNPPIAARLQEWLSGRGVGHLRWYRCAQDVNPPHQLRHPETAGADRALAVTAALRDRRPGRPGFVVLCGTAVTVERLDEQGVWTGGAIAAGLQLTAKALHTLTAQLPLVRPAEAPIAWGDSTRPALEAGVFWGVLGAIRELLTRQGDDLGDDPFLIWSGGDAATLAPWIDWPGARVEPDLVLTGLGVSAFGEGR